MDKKAFLKAFAITLVFMLGFMTSNIYADISTERPSIVSTLDDNRTDEVPSPSKWITEDKIGVYSQRVILDIEDPQWAMFTDTHSMEPVLSSRSYAIEIVPDTPDEINIGDIVSYKSKYADGIIIHRVIDKDYDSEGVYFILKGDNNPTPDPGKIRFEQLQRVVVAIIY
ncbi:MAG: signal peptidase I [Candidatus Woesearchaeota archaeon]